MMTEDKDLLGVPPHQEHGNELISIIVPAWNREGFICAALDSVKAQRYRPLEIVVVDDGSNDNTVAAASRWARGHTTSDLTLKIISQENGGPSAARNRGIRESSGSLLCFLDSDDALTEGSLDRRAAALANPELDFVYERVQATDSELRPLTVEPIGQEFDSTDPVTYHWHTLGALYRRELLERVGPWKECLINGEDLEYHARIKLGGAQGRMLPAIGGYYRQHNDARLVAPSFNERHVRMAAAACMAIAHEAANLGKLNSYIARRLARRLFMHALEFGSQGYFEKRDALIADALALPIRDTRMALSLNLLRLWPAKAPQGALYRLIRRVNG